MTPCLKCLKCFLFGRFLPWSLWRADNLSLGTQWGREDHSPEHAQWISVPYQWCCPGARLCKPSCLLKYVHLCISNVKKRLLNLPFEIFGAKLCKPSRLLEYVHLCFSNVKKKRLTKSSLWDMFYLNKRNNTWMTSVFIQEKNSGLHNAKTCKSQ